MTTLIARFNGQVLIPEQPVELPSDCLLEVTVQVVAVSGQDVPHQATLDLMRQWEREDQTISPEQRDSDTHVYDEIERVGIARTRV